MKPEAFYIFLAMVLVVIIMVANDWWKKQLIKRADRKRKLARKDLYNHRTHWGAVIALLLGGGAYACFLQNPKAVQRAFRPLMPRDYWIVIGAVVVLVMGGYAWSSRRVLDTIGQRLADEIGDCEHQFSRDGFFGPQRFVVTGVWHGVAFSIRSEKFSWRRYVSRFTFEKPASIDWEMIRSRLKKKQEFVAAASAVETTTDHVTLVYAGVLGNAVQIRRFLSEVSTAMERRISDGVNEDEFC